MPTARSARTSTMRPARAFQRQPLPPPQPRRRRQRSLRFHLQLRHHRQLQARHRHGRRRRPAARFRPRQSPQLRHPRQRRVQHGRRAKPRQTRPRQRQRLEAAVVAGARWRPERQAAAGHSSVCCCRLACSSAGASWRLAAHVFGLRVTAVRMKSSIAGSPQATCRSGASGG